MPDSVIEFVRYHPYFFANAPLLFVFILLPWCLRSREYGRLAFLSGLFCLPFGIVAVFHDGLYWQPARLADLPLGIEDFVFTYAIGTATWMAAAWQWRDSAARTAPVRVAVGRSLRWVAPCVVLTSALWVAGVDPMTITLVTAVALLVALLVRRRGLWPLSAAGALIFTVPYLLLVKLQFFVWPDYIEYWRPDIFWTQSFLGLPAGEIAWAIVFSGLWPVFVASVLGVRERPCETASQAGATQAPAPPGFS